MTEKSLPIVLLDIAAAGLAVFGVFLALEIFQVPNCTSVEREPLLTLAVPISIALVAGCVLEFVVGLRETSQLSKFISISCAFALMLFWLIYKWKLNAISGLAC